MNNTVDTKMRSHIWNAPYLRLAVWNRCSSYVSLVTNRYTVTSFCWPMRWQRAIACTCVCVYARVSVCVCVCMCVCVCVLVCKNVWNARCAASQRAMAKSQCSIAVLAVYDQKAAINK